MHSADVLLVPAPTGPPGLGFVAAAASWLTWAAVLAVAIIFIVAMMVSWLRYHRGEDASFGGKIGAFLGVGFLVIAGPAAINGILAEGDTANDASASGAPDAPDVSDGARPQQQPEQVDQPAQAAPPADDWYTHVDWLLIGGVVVAVLVVGAGTAAAVPAVRRRRKAAAARRAKSAEQQAARTRLYDNLVARHKAVDASYAEFLLDVFAILERPALNDVTVAATRTFLDAHARAADVRPDSCPADDDLLKVYEAAVRDVEATWRVADGHARRVGTGLLDAAERKKIDQAIRFLHIARNESATSAERHTCYEKATTLLAGIVTLPKEAVAALEGERRQVLALESGAVAAG